MKIQSYKSVVGLIGTIILSGCAAPSTKDIAVSAEGTAASTAVAASVVQLDVDIESKANIVNAAVSYVRTGNAPFPPAPGVFIGGLSDEDWAVRRALLQAISEYAAGLASASDPALESSFVEAASGLSLALSSFQTVQAGRIQDERRRTIALAEAQRNAAFGAILVSAAGYAVDLAVAARIRQKMSEMHPVVVAAARELKRDLALVSFSIGRKRNTLRIALREKLKLHAHDPRLSTADRYNLYIAALEELNAVDGRVQIASDFGSILDNMVKAHAELRDNNRNGEAFQEFLSQVQAISIKIQAYQEIDRSLSALRRA